MLNNHNGATIQTFFEPDEGMPFLPVDLLL